MFRSIEVHNWRQFHNVNIAFHERLTVLTGANGAGKTTLLHMLNRHWGWNIPYISSPKSDKKGSRRYWAGFWNLRKSPSEEEPPVPQYEIGKIHYRDHNAATLTIPDAVQETFSVDITPMHTIRGVYVPSHRPLYLHQKVEQIPTRVDARQQIFELYLAELKKTFTANARV